MLVNMHKARECPRCGNLYLTTKICTGDAENMCHEPVNTIETKEKRLDLEKGIKA